MAVAASTFEVIADIIVDVCGLERDTLRPTVNAVDELGIDSVDFLDILYEVDRRYGIKVPVEKWMEQINSGAATTAEFFVLERFAARIDELTQVSASAHASGPSS